MNTEALRCAIASLLGRGNPGDMAFTRALSSADIDLLLQENQNTAGNWRLVAVGASEATGWIRSDAAVEIRETKGLPTFLLIDAHTAGAGMDGVYSASREIDEETLFEKAIAIVRQSIDRAWREFADDAVKRARRVGARRHSTSLRQEFQFYGDLARSPQDAGRLVHSLGLWPLAGDQASQVAPLLQQSVLMVEKLLLPPATTQAVQMRVTGLVLSSPSEAQLQSLDALLRAAGSTTRDQTLAQVAQNPNLWLGTLRPAFLDSRLATIELLTWRRSNGNLFAWSGLSAVPGESLPHLPIDPDPDNRTTKLQVKWKAQPDPLPRGSVTYEARVIAGEEVLASRQVEHTGASEQKIIFTAEDFEDLDSSSKLEAYVEIAAPAQTKVKPVRTEDFIIIFGEASSPERISSGQVFRCLADGLVQTPSRDDLETFLDQRQKGEQATADKHGFVSCRLPGMRRGFRVERPRLLQEIETNWSRQSDDSIGRWIIRCRADGFWTSHLQFQPIQNQSCPPEIWARLLDVSRRFRDNALKAAGTLSRFYLHGHSSANLTSEYINAWQAALEQSAPALALAHTVEVQNPAGRTVGLIVLPSHPMRVAWQSAYDDLAMQLRFQETLPLPRVRRALSCLDSAHFPFMLPGLLPETNFVFGDVLGLCAVAMVSDQDREPKSAIATLSACFAGDSEHVAPALSINSGDALAREVANYLDAHPECSLVRVHALRPGDGATVVRAIGKALRQEPDPAAEQEDGPKLRNTAFQLELHPTQAQSGVAGAHLVKITQRRRAGVAAVPPDDAWSLESLPRGGGRSIPRLRWARREPDSLDNPAHVAIAFDTFASRVAIEPKNPAASPLLAFGLSANLQRRFSIANAQPCWRLLIPLDQDGLKLTNRFVTERLQKLQSALAATVARWSGSPDSQPLVKTIPTGDDVEQLASLHRLCDWVITVDRNAGVEYFDSPRQSLAIYEAYLIDAVPERDDLGCLQMITSTAHFDEVRHLLNETLALMGLSSSMRNCQFLLTQLKGLSGRLAMRLAAGGDDISAKRVGSELVALSLVRANCLRSSSESGCWLPLSNGFLVPLDDVRDLIPTAQEQEDSPPTDDAVTPVAEPEDSRRADLLFVFVPPRGRIEFRFAEVKYRRHLAMARASALVDMVLDQTTSTRERWTKWFFDAGLSASEKAIRLGRLVRVLRFYADKAHRHYLEDDTHTRICEELDRLLREPADYAPSTTTQPDRAFIFCPDYSPNTPEELFPGLTEDCRAWLFGPDTLPDKTIELQPSAPPPPPPVPPAAPTAPAADSTTEPEEPKAAEPKPDTAPAEPPPLPLVPAQGAPVVDLGEARSGQMVTWTPSITTNPHLMIVGLPGMGKTTCLINICQYLVAANVMPIVFSYHDDIDEKLAAQFPELTASDGRSLGFNPMRATQDGPLAHVESAGQLRDIFAAIFPDLGELQLEQLRGAIKQSFQEQGWGSGAAPGLQPPPFRRFVDLLRSLAKPDKGTQTLLARLNELDDFAFFDSEKGAKSLLDSTHPQILRVHASKSEAVQRAYASFVLYSIYQDMFRRGRPDRITHAVIFDEAHRAAKLKLIPTMAKECRKYGLAMIVASQEARDFDDSLYSAIANYLILRVTDQDARALARNVAPSEIERRTADRLKTLPKYEALFFSESHRQPLHMRLAQAK
jgi:DNA phosphorothioation-dependent restriction protein DptH